MTQLYFRHEIAIGFKNVMLRIKIISNIDFSCKVTTLILNCQSLRGKVEAFQSSVDYFQPDCILGTKSWLNKSVSTNEIFPPGYNILWKDRITSTQGGGVFIAVKENYDVSLLPDIDRSWL